MESYESRFNDFFARTGRIDIILKMRDLLDDRMARIFKTPVETLRLLRSSHKVCGGLASDKDASVDLTFELEDAGHVDIDEEDLTRVKRAPGIRDYALALARLFDMKSQSDLFIKRLTNATLNASAVLRKSLKSEITKDLEQHITYRALYKVHHYVCYKTDFGKAKLVGMAIDVLHNYSRCRVLARHLRSATDKIKFLSVVT
jgi:hypothetical protein